MTKKGQRNSTVGKIFVLHTADNLIKYSPLSTFRYVIPEHRARFGLVTKKCVRDEERAQRQCPLFCMWEGLSSIQNTRSSVYNQEKLLSNVPGIEKA